MKKRLVFLLFSLSLFSQERFDNNIIKKNNITKALKYFSLDGLDVNLKLDAEFTFNNQGKISNSIYFDGAQSSRSKPKNLIENFIYSKDRVEKKIRISFDTITTSYNYFENNRKILGIVKNIEHETIGLEIIKMNLKNKNEYKLQIDFTTTSIDNLYLHYSIFEYNYKKNKNTIVETRRLFEISLNELNLLKKITDVNEIEKMLNKIKTSNVLIDHEHHKIVSLYNTSGDIVKEISENLETQFKYDYNHLMTNEILNYTNSNIKVYFLYKYDK